MNLTGSYKVGACRLASVVRTPLVPTSGSQYNEPMIKSFRCKDTESIFRRQHVRSLPTYLQRRAHLKLLALHSASALDDLRQPPGNRLEYLSGNRKGQHSIRINDQFRVCFLWHEGHAYEVEIVDYH